MSNKQTMQLRPLEFLFWKQLVSDYGEGWWWCNDCPHFVNILGRSYGHFWHHLWPKVPFDFWLWAALETPMVGSRPWSILIQQFGTISGDQLGKGAKKKRSFTKRGRGAAGEVRKCIRRKGGYFSDLGQWTHLGNEAISSLTNNVSNNFNINV